MTLARGGSHPDAPPQSDGDDSSDPNIDWLETGLLSVLTSVTVAMVAATTLAAAGVFSIWGLAAILFGYCLSAVGLRTRLGASLPQPGIPSVGPTAPVFASLAVVVVAGVLLLRPFENALVLQDPAVYLDSGINIAKTGGVKVDDGFYHSLSPETQDALASINTTGDGYRGKFRLRGFLIDQNHGTTVPQFFQMPPAWIATFDSMWGTHGALYAIPLLAVLGVAAVFAAARRLFGLWAAVLAATLLLADAAEIWWGRNHDSDIVYQALLFGGIFAWCRYEATKRTEVAAVAGLLLGAIAFARADAFLVLGPLALFLGWQAVSCRWERGTTALVATLVPLTIVAAIFAVTVERPYTLLQYHAFVGGIRPYAYAAAAAAAALLVALLIIRPRRALDIVRTRELTPALRGAAAAIVLGALLAYFVRPLFAPSVPGFPDEEAIRSAKYDSLVRLGWYLSQPGMIAAVAGLAAIMVMRPTRSVALFLLLVLAPTLFYLQDPRVNADHIWASRRFIAATIPAAAIAAGFVLSEVAGLGRWRPRTDAWRYGGQTAAAVAGIAILALTLRSTAPILRHSEQRGAIDQIEAASATIPRDAVVLLSPSFSAGLIAPPMKLLGGRDTYVEEFTTPSFALEELVHAATDRGRPAYFVLVEDGPPRAAPAGVFTVQPFVYTKTASFVIDVPILQLRFDGIPRDGTRLQATGTVYKIAPAP